MERDKEAHALIVHCYKQDPGRNHSRDRGEHLGPSGSLGHVAARVMLVIDPEDSRLHRPESLHSQTEANGKDACLNESHWRTLCATYAQPNDARPF